MISNFVLRSYASFSLKRNITFGVKAQIEAFTERYIVNPDLVKEYLEHLTNIEVRKNVRQEETRQAKKDQ